MKFDLTGARKEGSNQLFAVSRKLGLHFPGIVPEG
jgi:hypothetical protein